MPHTQMISSPVDELQRRHPGHDHSGAGAIVDPMTKNGQCCDRCGQEFVEPAGWLLGNGGKTSRAGFKLCCSCFTDLRWFVQGQWHTKSPFAPEEEHHAD